MLGRTQTRDEERISQPMPDPMSGHQCQKRWMAGPPAISPRMKGRSSQVCSRLLPLCAGANNARAATCSRRQQLPPTTRHSDKASRRQVMLRGATWGSSIASQRVNTIGCRPWPVNCCPAKWP
jgi:hypothetical protein